MEEWALLFGMDGIDLTVLENHVNELVARHGSVSLEEVLRNHPPEKGLAEIMGYFRLAVTRASSRIDSSRKWKLVIPSGDDSEDIERHITIPEVIYG